MNLKKQRHKVSGKRLSVLGFLLLLACSQVIDLGTEENEGGQLVIFGRLTDGTDGNELNISRTGLLGQPPIPVDGALVTVHDVNGLVARYSSVGEGNYRLETSLPVAQPGNAYSLRVETGNNIYESRPEEMPVISARDSLYFSVEEIIEASDQGTTFSRFVVSVKSDTEVFDPRPDLYIKWDLEESYSFEQAVLPRHNFPFYFRFTCFFTNELEQQRVSLYDGSELRLSKITGEVQTSRDIDETFRSVHYFNLIHQSLTREAHSFWNGLDQNVNRVGSIFDRPPGELPTNLYDVNDPAAEVLGYFVVAAVDTARLRVTNSQLGQFFPEPCPLNPEVNFAPFMDFRWIAPYYDPECLDCLVLPNGTHDRPSYFK